MRVLVIDHTGGIEVFREKYRLLAAAPDMDLTLFAPVSWIENGREVRCDTNADGYRIRTGRASFRGYENRGFFYTGLAATIREARPHVIHLLEEPYSLIALQSVMLARIFCPDARIVFYTFDNLQTGFRYPYRPSWFYGLVQRHVQRHADMGTASCIDAGNVLRSRAFDKPIRFTPLAVDEKRYRRKDVAQKRADQGLGAFVIGFVGRMLPAKGIAVLLDALLRLEGDWSCVFLGSGSEADTIRKFTAEHDLADRIRIVPGVPHAEVPDYINLMDVLVVPSQTTHKWKEQFGRVLIEAMACSVPVIGSDSGAIPEVVGDAGVIFPERDSEELARILIALQGDPKRREAMGDAGRARVLQYFTWKRVAESYRSIYDDLMSGAPVSERAPAWSISS